jgi:hypothetical protein
VHLWSLKQQVGPLEMQPCAPLKGKQDVFPELSKILPLRFLRHSGDLSGNDGAWHALGPCFESPHRQVFGIVYIY